MNELLLIHVDDVVGRLLGRAGSSSGNGTNLLDSVATKYEPWARWRMADGGLTSEILENWYTPKQVVDLLPDGWDLQLKHTAIAHRMQAGTIRSAALRVIAGRSEYVCALLQPSVWDRWAFNAFDTTADHFWEGASFERWNATAFGGSDVHIRLFGVRLHPVDITTMFSELGVQVAGSSHQGMLAAAIRASPLQPPPKPVVLPKLPLISDAKLKTWLDSYAVKHPSAVHWKIKAEAAAKFPAFRIGKNQLYRVMTQVYGALKIGNPTISRP